MCPLSLPSSPTSSFCRGADLFSFCQSVKFLDDLVGNVSSRTVDNARPRSAIGLVQHQCETVGLSDAGGNLYASEIYGNRIREIQFRGYTDPRGFPLSQSEGMVTRHLQADPAPPPGCTAAATGAAAHQPVRRPARPRTQGSDRTPRQPRRPPRDDRPRDPSTDRPTILCDAGGRRDDPRHLAGRPAQHGLATARHTILARARSVAILSGRARPGTPAPRFSLRTRTWGSSGRRVSRIPVSVP